MTEFAVTDRSAIPGWEGILDPGEKIVWQGRPEQGFDIAAKDIPSAVFALFFSGFAVFWIVRYYHVALFGVPVVPGQ